METEEHRGGAIGEDSDVTAPTEPNGHNDDVTSCPVWEPVVCATKGEPHTLSNSLSPETTSCQTGAGADVVMTTEQDEVFTPGKAGSGSVVVHGNNNKASETLERVRKWSQTQYKCTRQVLCEKMGRGSRTVDLDLQPRLEVLKDDQQRYCHVTKLAQTLASQISGMASTHQALGDTLAELGLKTPPLHVEFGLNAESQRFLCKSGESLAASINTFTTGMNTLLNKTIEDTMVNVKQYESARIEYDAYRCDLEELNMGPRDGNTLPKLEQAQSEFQKQKERYRKTKEDLTVKLNLLQENKVKVLHNQLYLLHSSLSSHCSSCHQHLERSMQEASLRLGDPSTDSLSWLEES